MPTGLGGVAAKLEVILEEMLEVRGLPTGRMPSISCNETRRGKGNGKPAQEGPGTYTPNSHLTLTCPAGLPTSLQAETRAS